MIPTPWILVGALAGFIFCTTIGFFVGKSYTEARYVQAQIVTLKKDAKDVVTLEEKTQSAKVIVKEHLKVIHASTEECLDLVMPDDLYDSVR